MSKHRLPEGTITDDATAYIRAWRKIYKPLAKALGAKVIGFDPDVLFDYKGKSFSLPLWAVQAINEALLK